MSSAEWRELETQASLHGLGLFLHHLLAHNGTVDPQTRATLSNSLSVVASALFADEVCGHARAVLDGAGIEFLPLKGILFRHTLYPDPGMRPAADIDLLVPPGCLDRAETALLGADYRRIDDWGARRSASARSNFERTFIHPEIAQPGCALEIHDGFCRRDRYRLNYAALWRRATSIDGLAQRAGTQSAHRFGPNARALSVEDTLIHLFVHGAKHLFAMPLTGFVDVRLIAERWRPDWDVVVERARAARCAGAGYFLLRIARDHLGARIPGNVLERLRPGRGRRLWLERVGGVGVPHAHGQSVAFSHGFDKPGVAFASASLLVDGARGSFEFAASYTVRRAADAGLALWGSDSSLDGA